MSKRIIWNCILQGYNDQYGTYFISLYALMYNLYVTQSKSTSEMDPILGVSTNAINQKLRGLKILVNRPGWPKDRIGTKMRTIREMDRERIRDMTVKEIQKEAECSRAHAQKVMKTFGIKYKRKRRVYYQKTSEEIDG